MSKGEEIRRIVVLADGTGNAFGSQESNVWRLYESLDLTCPDQVAMYLKGVGTSGFRPFAVFDGATGVGVPSNVRKLYAFLCWNWRPGVSINVFGFSRGAFTVRTLIGLIDSEGLLPAAFDGNPVSHAEMARNVMAAWRSYRTKTAGGRNVWITITVTRFVRDVLLGLWHGVLGHRPYKEVRGETDRQRRQDVPIAFAGLFDTVEAYGVPIAELRKPIDRAIWPMSFRNRVLSGKVARARHALSLDDERTTFHPVRFDLRKEPTSVADQASADEGVVPRIMEVWFAGVHSDVGGGYPDDRLSHVPLAWMMKEALAAGVADGDPLRFKEGAPEAIVDFASPLGPVHDSRSGLAALYRYDPRSTVDVRSSDYPPVVHHSVAEKMVYGTENYAPLTLPDRARVLMPGGRLAAIAGFQAAGIRTEATTPKQAAKVREYADLAVARLNRPNAAFVELARDMIWWRRVCYFMLVASALLSTALPVTAPWLDRGMTTALVWTSEHAGLDRVATYLQERVDDARNGLGANLNDVSNTFGGFIPGYTKGWVQGLVDQPAASAMLLLLTVTLYRLNASLRLRIADLARCAWFYGPGEPALSRTAALMRSAFGHIKGREPRPGIHGWFVARGVKVITVPAAIARILRRSRGAGMIYVTVADRVIPSLALLCMGYTAFALAERTIVAYRSGSGAMCRAGATPAEKAQDHEEGVPVTLSRRFTPDAPCWPSGVLVREGRTYNLWLEEVEPFQDGSKVVGISGFTSSSAAYVLGLPFRRSWAADWFAPLARIGTTGNIEWQLRPILQAVSPEMLREPADARTAWLHPCSKAEGGNARIDENAGTATLRSFGTQFTAQASGELFLFVNDVIGAVPFGPLTTCFYDNNRGAAKVTVELVPGTLPPRQPSGLTSGR